MHDLAHFRQSGVAKDIPKNVTVGGDAGYIAVFLITSTAGRRGLLLGGLILSAVMLRSHVFSKVSACVGMVASALLFFAGDIGTALFSSSNIIAILIGIGYALWMIWFFLIGRRLFQLGQ